jgi:hypothetical protein
VWSLTLTTLSRVQALEREGALTDEEAAKAREFLQWLAKSAARRLLGFIP